MATASLSERGFSSILFVIKGFFNAMDTMGVVLPFFSVCVLKVHLWLEFVLLWLNVKAPTLSREGHHHGTHI